MWLAGQVTPWDRGSRSEHLQTQCLNGEQPLHFGVGISLVRSVHLSERVSECVYTSSRWGSRHSLCVPYGCPQLRGLRFQAVCLLCPLDMLSGAEAVPGLAGGRCPSSCQEQSSAPACRSPHPVLPPLGHRPIHRLLRKRAW